MKTKKKTIIDLFADKLSKLFPDLKLNLIIADIDKTPKQFIADSLRQTILISIFLLITIVFSYFILELKFLALLGPIIIIFGFFFFFMAAVGSVKSKIKKDAIDIESNLAYAVKSIRIHLTSGATLFEVFINVSQENYGALSEKFKKAVKEISMGRPIIEVIEEMTERTQSLYFKNAMWPLIGGLKSGGDIIKIMDEVSKSLSKQQINQATKYGGKIQTISMISVVLSIVLPSVIMIGSIIGSVFMGFTEVIVKIILFMIVVYIVIVNLGLIILVSMNRPSLVKR